MATDLNQPRVFRAPRLSGFGAVAWVLLLAALWSGRNGWVWKPDVFLREPSFWVFAALLAVFSVRAVYNALFPVTLAFGPQGLSWGRFGRRRRLAWSEVGVFKVQLAGVAFDYADHYRPEERAGRQFERASRGAEARLPGGLNMPPHVLADALNKARERWAA